MFSISERTYSRYGIIKIIPENINNLPYIVWGVISPKPIVVMDTKI